MTTTPAPGVTPEMILPCPFCGLELVRRDDNGPSRIFWSHPESPSDECIMEHYQVRDNPGSIGRWNQRAALRAQPIPGTVGVPRADVLGEAAGIARFMQQNWHDGGNHIEAGAVGGVALVLEKMRDALTQGSQP